MCFSCISKEHQIVVGRCHDQVGHKVVFTRRQSCDSLSTTLLCLIRISRDTLQITQMGEGDSNLFFFDQVFIIHLICCCRDLGSSFVAPFFLDFQKLVLYNSHKLLFISQQFLIVSDPLAKFFIFTFYFFAFQTLQSGKTHI